MEAYKISKIKENIDKFSSAKSLISWTQYNGLYDDFVQELKDIPEYETIENIAYSILKGKPIKICPVCGKYINYNKIKRGKDKFCSDVCYRSPKGLEIAKQRRMETNIQKYGSYEAAKKAHHDKWVESIQNNPDSKVFSQETVEKRQKTMLDRYGATTTLGSDILKAKVENTMEKRYGEKEAGHCKEIRDKIDKTNLEKYGHRCVFGGNEMKEKIKQTNLDRYGTEYAAASKVIQDKIKQTNLERYGVSHPLENKEIKEKAMEVWNGIRREQVIDRVKAAGFDLVDEKSFTTVYDSYYDIKCQKCGTIINRRLSPMFSYRCPTCNPYTCSDCEQAIMDLLNKWNIKFVPHVRNILPDGKELDIVIEDKKIAIEVDGIYWHNELSGKDKNYHLNKTIECEKAGYSLIHIFSDEIKHKFNTVKKRLADILDVNFIKIDASNCEIKLISKNMASKFINKYNLEGAILGIKVNLGLFYKNRIIAVMTFTTPHYDSKYDWELVQYCTMNSIYVNDGMNLLLSYFKNNYKGTIITYIDKRWSYCKQDIIYKNLGFEHLYDTNPNYFYTKGEIRENRVFFNHDILKNMLKNYDKNCSVDQNLANNGFSKIWDCGNKIYILKND